MLNTANLIENNNMARRPRLMLENVPFHVITRGNNRSACFFADQDYRVYLSWLKMYAIFSNCEIHAYVLMTNHVHLLLSSYEEDGVSVLMKALGQRYAQYVNSVYDRSGSIWDGRFHSCATQEEKYFLTCQRYIELNPVRAKMVADPAEYHWSSYRSNAQGEPNALITPHALYLSLGNNDEARHIAYRELFHDKIGNNLVTRIRQATNGNFALKDSNFAPQLTKKLDKN